LSMPPKRWDEYAAGGRALGLEGEEATITGRTNHPKSGKNK